MTHRSPSWLRLNGYGVLVALLELGIATFFFIGGGGGPVRTVGHLGIGLAGAGLIYAYARVRVVAEVYASALLVVSNLLLFYVQVRTSIEAQSVVLQIIIIVAVTMRISAVLEGGTIVLPTWRRHGTGEAA